MLKPASSSDERPAPGARKLDGRECAFYAAVRTARGDEQSVVIPQDLFGAALHASRGDPFRIHADAQSVGRMSQRTVDSVVCFVVGIEISHNRNADGTCGDGHLAFHYAIDGMGRLQGAIHSL